MSFLSERGLSERFSCRLLGINRSSIQYHAREDRNQAIKEELREFAASKRRRGYRKAHVHLVRRDLPASRNRVHRLWKQLGLQIPRRKGRKRKPPGPSGELPLVAEYPNHVWSYDFLFDATAKGTRLKMLTIGDDYTRECLFIDVATSITADRLVGVLARLFEEHGDFGKLSRAAPRFLRSDNGPEFIAHALRAWLMNQRTETFYIRPGSPWENGFRESFHGRFRDEFLYGTLFASVAESRVLVEQHRQEYNTDRPHQSLGYLTPAEFKQQWHERHSSPDGV